MLARRNVRAFPTKMDFIAWFECSECLTEWHEFVAIKGVKRPCQGSNCKKTLIAKETRRKAFGHFQCTKCRKKWSSAHTYPDTFQKCKSCNIEIFPYKLEPLEFSGEEERVDNLKPHLQSLCGRCIQLGFRCCDAPSDIDDVIKRFSGFNI